MNKESWESFKRSLQEDGLNTSRLDDEYMWIKPSLDGRFMSLAEEYAGEAPASMNIEELSELARSYVTDPEVGTVEQWIGIFEYTAIVQRLRAIDWNKDDHTPDYIKTLDSLAERYVDRFNSDWFNLYRKRAMDTNNPFVVGLKQDGVEFLEIKKEASDSKGITDMFFSFAKTRYFFCHKDSKVESERKPMEVDGLILLVSILKNYSRLFEIEIDGSVVKFKNK